MEDEAERLATMQRDVLLIVTAGLSLLNGMHFSPFFDPVFFLMRPFAAGFFITSPILLFYFTSLFISLLTLLVGGIPAAIYERANNLQQSTPVSIGIWLAGVAIFAAPTFLGFFGGR
ncbi:hypothetical protein [Phreatobacter sp.]|uniref:hypothetical protein n=1 Tax=Phreatobacter sp. TaxID=1966341 RepID=UPI003F6ED093